MNKARALPLPLLVTLPLLLLTLGPGGARADTVYRCSGPGGTLYSQQPCPGGQAVDVQDARTDEQRRTAQQGAAQEAALADRMTREREQREARVRPGAAVGIRGERGGGNARPAITPTPLHAASAAKPSKKKKKAPKPVKQPA